MMKFRLVVFSSLFLFSNLFGSFLSTKAVAVSNSKQVAKEIVEVEKKGDENKEIYDVMAVVMVGWLGIFLFLLKIQRDIKNLEKEVNED